MLRRLLLALTFSMLAAGQANAYLAYVSNEKSNTVSVIDTEQMGGGANHQGRPAAARHRVHRTIRNTCSSRSAMTIRSR